MVNSTSHITAADYFPVSDMRESCVPCAPILNAILRKRDGRSKPEPLRVERGAGNAGRTRSGSGRMTDPQKEGMARVRDAYRQ